MQHELFYRLLAQHRVTASTMGCILTISALATIINIVLISGGLSQGPISPYKRMLKFQREDMEMWDVVYFRKGT